MERNHFLLAAGVAGLGVLAGGSLALAATEPFQGVSNQSIRAARGQIYELIDELQFDDADYHGFRVRAIAQLNAAKDELLKALQARGQAERGEAASDNSMHRAAQVCDAIISNLNADNADYAGHRVNALEDLKRARDLIRQGLGSTS